MSVNTTDALMFFTIPGISLASSGFVTDVEVEKWSLVLTREALWDRRSSLAASNMPNSGR